MSARGVIGACVMTACMFCAGSFVRAAVNSEGVLDGYRDSLEFLRACSMRVIQRDRVTIRGETTTSTLMMDSMRSETAAACEYRRWSADGDLDAVGDPHAVLTVPQEVTTYTEIGGRMLAFQRLQGSPEPIVFVSYSTPSHQYASWQGAVLVGYFPGDADRIDRVIEAGQVTVRSEPEFIDGLKCIVLDSQTRDARYSVWFAPDRDFCIVRLVRVREGAAVERSTESTVRPSGATRVRMTQTLHGVVVERVQDRWIPVEGTCTEELTFADGPPALSTTRVRRERISLEPTGDANALTLDIPNGTRVRFIGQHNAIPHEWRDGTIMPREDKAVTARLDALVGDERFTTDSANTSQLILLRGPAMFLAAVLACAGGAVLLQRLPGLRRVPR